MVERTTWRFPFRSAFPARDMVGHFVIALASAHNDLLLTNRVLVPIDDPGDAGLLSAERMSLLRLALAQIWETHLLVKAADGHPVVSTFIDRIGAEYPGELDGPLLVEVLRGNTGVSAPRFRQVLRTARNFTNHYPKPGSTEIVAALAMLADYEVVGQLSSGESVSSLRAEFADEVMLRVALPDMDEAMAAELFAATAETTVAIVHLSQAAVGLYLIDHGVDLTSPPPD